MFIHPAPSPSLEASGTGVKASTVLVLVGINLAIFALLASGFFVYKHYRSSAAKASTQVLEVVAGSELTVDSVTETKGALVGNDELDNAEKGLSTVSFSGESSTLSPVKEPSTVSRGIDPKALQKQVEEHQLTVAQFQQLCVQALEVRRNRIALKKERLKSIARKLSSSDHSVTLHEAVVSSIPPPDMGDEEATVESLFPRGEEGVLDKLLASLGIPVVYDDDEDRRLSLSASSISEVCPLLMQKSITDVTVSCRSHLLIQVLRLPRRRSRHQLRNILAPLNKRRWKWLMR